MKVACGMAAHYWPRGVNRNGSESNSRRRLTARDGLLSTLVREHIDLSPCTAAAACPPPKERRQRRPTPTEK